MSSRHPVGPLLLCAAISLTLATTAAGQASATSIAFIENIGQWSPDDRFIALGDAYSVRAQQDGSVVLQLQRPQTDAGVEARLVRLSFGMGAPEAEDLLPGLHHFFCGNDSSRWVTGASAFAGLAWHDAATGVDLRLTSGANGLQFEWRVPGDADLSGVGVSVEGGCWVDPDDGTDADPVLRTPFGDLHLVSPPDSAADHASSVRTRLRDDGLLGLARDSASSQDLVVSTTLQWSTFLGGTFGDAAHSAAVNDDGQVVVLGRTYSTDFPVTPGAFDEEFTLEGTSLWADLAVAALDQDTGELQWATYLGGGSEERPAGIGFLFDGSILVGAQAFSADYPVTMGPPPAAADIALSKLASTGDALLASRVIGGAVSEEVVAVTVTGGTAIHVAGSTRSPDFPVTLPGFHVGEPGQFNNLTYVMRVDPADLAIVWSLLIGGTENNDFCQSLAVNAAGDVGVSISSPSVDLPLTPNALSTDNGGGAYIVIRNEGTELAFSSYLPWDSLRAGGARAISLDHQGRVVLSGVAQATDFPFTDFPDTPNAFQPEPNSQLDGFVLHLDWEEGEVLAATHLGGFWHDAIVTRSIDSSGVMTFLGSARGTGFPTTNGAFQETKPSAGGDFDIVVCRLDPTLEELLYSTYLGGSDDDEFLATHIQEGTWEGGVIVPVDTQSSDYPVTPGAPGETIAGSADFGVTHLTMLPEGVTRFGLPTASVIGLPVLGTGSWPGTGDGAFKIVCSGAPPSTTNGILALSLGALARPLVAKGAGLWLDPASLILFGAQRTSELGYSSVPLPVPDDPALVGLTVYVQMFWPGLAATGTGGMAASNALAITVQDGS